MIRKVLCIIALASGFGHALYSGDFKALRDMASESAVTEIPQGTIIEGVVVSDRHSLNMADNPNTAWNEVDLGENFRTVYLQSPDAKYGLKIISSSVYNPAEKFSKVKIDLSGAKLLKETNPERYTVFGLSPEAVSVIGTDVSVAPKRKYVSELTDEDLYTYVSVVDVEFSEKQGSFTNVYEPAVQQTWLNSFKTASGYTDTWASMLKDSKGDEIYMLVNTKCTWRRRGDWLPQGKGEVTGVLVYSDMRRHGGVGPYSLRPSDPSEIRIAKEPATSYTTVVEWNWDRNYECALNLEKGRREWILSDLIPSDRILPDKGEGYLSTVVPSELALDAEFDARCALDGCEGRYGYGYGEGSREYGAVSFVSDVAAWYGKDDMGKHVPVNAILLETSTLGLEGSAATLDWTWMAGHERKIDYAWGFPTEWNVLWSVDGNNWNIVDEVICLRPMYWNDKEIKGVGKRNLSYDAALGYTSHSIKLPREVIGCEKLLVRIAPCSDAVAVIPSDPSESIGNGRMRDGFSHRFYLNLGKLSLKLVK